MISALPKYSQKSFENIFQNNISLPPHSALSPKKFQSEKKIFCMGTNILDTYSFFSDNGYCLFKEWSFFPKLTRKEGTYDNYR